MTWFQRHPRLVACSGLILAPAIWGVCTQLGLILPYAECGSAIRPLLIVTMLLTAATVASGWMSWRASWTGRTGRFMSVSYALLALTFAYALVLQVLASATLSGCER